MVAAGCLVLRVWLRVGGALLLREEPPGHVQASLLFVRRGLGDVQGHPGGEGQDLIGSCVAMVEAMVSPRGVWVMPQMLGLF